MHNFAYAKGGQALHFSKHPFLFVIVFHMRPIEYLSQGKVNKIYQSLHMVKSTISTLLTTY
jgi:hypothetical protein